MTRIVETVKWFNNAKGFGFLEPVTVSPALLSIMQNRRTEGWTLRQIAAELG